MVFEETIEIPKEKVKKLQAFLNRKRESKNKDDIAKFTAKFQNGFEADVKICNGNPPFVDCYLVNKGGVGVAYVDDCDRELLGEYFFIHGDDEYYLTVKSV